MNYEMSRLFEEFHEDLGISASHIKECKFA